MTNPKWKIHHAESLKEAINNLQDFFEADMWFAHESEWKSEKDMLEYLRAHFNIFRKELKGLRLNEK